MRLLRAGRGAGRWSGRRAWQGAGLAAALVIAAAAGLFVATRRQLRLPYDGVTAARALRGWDRLGGTWTVQGSTVVNDSYERGAKLLYGSQRWSDYMVRADVELSGTGGDAGLILRSRNEEEGSNAYSGYYAGLRGIDGRLVLGHAQYGWLESRTSAFPGNVLAHRWYHLVLAAVGCDVLAVATDAVSGARDSVELTGKPCFLHGRMGLRSYGTAARWRNVQAQAIDAGELAALRAQATRLPGRGDGTMQAGTPVAIEPAAAVVAIGSLRYGVGLRPDRVTVRGTVVLRRPMLFVEDATGGIAIPGQDPSGFATGDEVEVTGTPLPEGFGLSLRDARVRVVEPGRPLPPKSVTGTEGATGAYAGEYVELIGRVMRRGADSGGASLLLAADAQQFRVVLPPVSYDAPMPRLPRNALVRVRGVEVVDAAEAGRGTPFLLYLPDAESIDLLARPPWWSLQNAVWLVPMTLMVVLAWLLLRSRERHRRLQAVTDERQRLGRELHDTLAQSFAGIGYQLQAVRTSLRTRSDQVDEHVELALEMVRASHREARRSIASMQPELTDGRRLAALLEERACQLARGTPLLIRATTKGDVRPLAPRAADALFHVGLEAIANALQHASPAKLLIELEFTRSEATLRIADDGRGFDATRLDGGLGLQGMRARTDAAGARVSLESAPGEGTQVVVSVPRRAAGLLEWVRWQKGGRA